MNWDDRKRPKDARKSAFIKVFNLLNVGLKINKEPKNIPQTRLVISPSTAINDLVYNSWNLTIEYIAVLKG